MNFQPPLMFSSWRSCLWSEWNTPALPKMGHPICSWGFSFFPFFSGKKKQTSAPIRGISSHYFQVSQPWVLISSSIYHDKLIDKRPWYMYFWWNKIKYVFHPYNVATTDEFKLRKLCETNSVAKIANIASFWTKHLHCFETHLICIYLMHRNNFANEWLLSWRLCALQNIVSLHVIQGVFLSTETSNEYSRRW